MHSRRTASLVSAAAAAMVPTVGALLALGGVPRLASAQQPTPALTHLAHVATRFDGAPGGRGLTVTAAHEVNAAMMHANRAAGRPDDLEAMKSHVRHLLHALAPAAGASGPGLGYGVRRAADGVATHIEMAAKDPGASETIRKLAPAVATASRALAARAQAMAELGARVLAAKTAADARPLVQDLRTMALELDTGRDANGNGRIDLDATEPGMNQLEAQVYSILEGEKLPRILQ
jgi:hypothetical protein